MVRKLRREVMVTTEEKSLNRMGDEYTSVTMLHSISSLDPSQNLQRIAPIVSISAQGVHIREPRTTRRWGTSQRSGAFSMCAAVNEPSRPYGRFCVLMSGCVMKYSSASRGEIHRFVMVERYNHCSIYRQLNSPTHRGDVLLHLRCRGPNVMRCDASFKKGDEMGWFQHGSTIVVFAPKGFAVCAEIADGRPLLMGQALMRLPD